MTAHFVSLHMVEVWDREGNKIYTAIKGLSLVREPDKKINNDFLTELQ